jgi:hypothetical protein
MYNELNGIGILTDSCSPRKAFLVSKMENSSGNIKFWHYLIIALLCSLPFAFLFYQAWYSPGIEFLVPSFRGDWILHSVEKISGTVEFRRQFQLVEVPAKCSCQPSPYSQARASIPCPEISEDSDSLYTRI